MKVVPTWCPQQCCFAFGMAPHFGVIVLGLFSLLYGGNTMGRLLTSCLVFSTEAGLLRCLIVLEGNHRRRHVVAETFHFFFSATFWKKKKQVSSCFFGHLPWREGNFTFLEGWSKMRSLAGSERCILWEKTTANRSGRLWKHPRSLGCPWCYLLSACVIAFFILYCDEDSVRKCIFLFIIRCRRVFECTNRVYLEQLYLYAFVVPRCTC